MIEQSRRGFLRNLVAFTAAAPAIVRASSLMPVKAMPSVNELDLLKARMEAAYALTCEQLSANLYGNLIDETRRAFVPRLFVDVADVYDKWPICDWSEQIIVGRSP